MSRQDRKKGKSEWKYLFLWEICINGEHKRDHYRDLTQFFLSFFLSLSLSLSLSLVWPKVFKRHLINTALLFAWYSFKLLPRVEAHRGGRISLAPQPSLFNDCKLNCSACHYNFISSLDFLKEHRLGYVLFRHHRPALPPLHLAKIPSSRMISFCFSPFFFFFF